jgi:VIT1/CCC1 family predicted Fe2+/Mn2+ transporter
MASAASFSVGAALPLTVVAIAPSNYLIASVAITCLACLLFLGGWSAKVGGANMRVGAVRVAFWSAVAMAVTTAVGAAVGRL